MFAPLPVLAIAAMVVLAWRGSRDEVDARALRRRLLTAFLLALALRLTLEWLGRAAPGGGRIAAAVAAGVAALALFWPLARLGFSAPWRRGERVTRLVFAGIACLTFAQGSRGAAAFLFWIALTRHRWLARLGTGERFRASVGSLAALLALVVGVRPPGELPGLAGAGARTAELVRWVTVVYAGIGTVRAFKAFTSDPTLGIRRVSRRLALSHVLVVTVPLLIVVALWISSTYLGVNADRALVTARVADHEALRLRDALAVALGSGGDAPAAARAAAAPERTRWPGTRVFLVRGGEVARLVGGPAPGESLLAGWVARLDSLPDRGIVQLERHRWLGAAARRGSDALVALVPVAEALDRTLSPLVGASVTMRALAPPDFPGDSLGASARALGDSLRALDAAGASADSAALERVRSFTRRLGVPDSAVRADRRRGRVAVTAGGDTLDARDSGVGLTGQVTVHGVSHTRRGWRPDRFTLTARASFRATLGGLFAKVRENPLQAIPIAVLAGLALLLLPLARTNMRMVAGMGGSIARGIGALRDGAAAFGEGRLAYRIPIEGDDDLWETARRFNQMAEGLERARELEKERDRLEHELELARRIQARLLPAAAPRVPGLDIAGLSESAREVGGDYYDHLDLGGGRVLLVIADVSGKGVPAALLMSGFRASLMSQDTSGGAPDVLARRLNDFLHRSVEPGRFVTAFLGFLDAASGRFVYVNAGHNPPVLLRAGGEERMLSEGGLILGIVPDSPFATGDVTLAPGDLVALYTDGVTEGANARNEQWGEERLVAALRADPGAPAAGIASRIVRDVRAFEGESGPADDITVLVARRTGPAA